MGAVLLPLADAKGVIGMQEPSVYRPGEPLGWRIPELGYARREHVSERGIEGVAELIVEVRSPGDETHDKLPFYGEVGCRELLVVDRDSLAVEVFVRREGRMVPTAAEASGRFRLESVDASVAPGIRIEWPTGAADIALD